MQITVRSMSWLRLEAFVCFFLGFVRSWLNSSFFLGDFLGGGTDLFGALLALCGVYNACAMNGAPLSLPVSGCVDVRR